MNNIKYILVTGGVISGVGKGVISSSFGTILKYYNLEVTSIKIDPYINLDAGTFSPYEHGEVYVLDDGGEVDLDLGNYERFMDITLHRNNNITTGKIYKTVIDKERRGDYLGKTVQVVPHITDAIQEWVENVAQVPVSKSGKTPEVCIIELGGTIGDIESMAFVEAFRQFQFRVKRENFCTVHVSLVPQPRSTGEQKTKPTQASVRELRGLGLSPDIIVCRSEKPVDQTVRNKISNFCHVAPQQVICIPDLPSIYEVPIFMQSDFRIADFLNERLQLGIKQPKNFMGDWIDLSNKIANLRNSVKISLVGKYTRLEDSYTSITKALQHAGHKFDYNVNIKFIEASNLEEAMLHENPSAYHQAHLDLSQSEGVIVPGGFGKRGIEGKIKACEWCRTRNIPFLGICLGFQTAVIEYSRNVLNLKDAHSTECGENLEYPVIIDMPEHNTGQMGGTMRLGKRTTVFQENIDSKIKSLYGNKESIEERHRHRYEVNPHYIKDLESGGLQFVGRDVDGQRMEILELRNHPYFVATQYHPEYLSRPMAPSPPFEGLILAAVHTLESYLISIRRDKTKLNGNALNGEVTLKQEPIQQMNDSAYSSCSSPDINLEKSTP